eukprot:scaffold142927_cov40-Prasinocladus_malaysianus.AAC.1
MSDQVFGFSGHDLPHRVAGEAVLAVSDLLEELGQPFVGLEGREAGEQAVQDHPAGPNVCLQTIAGEAFGPVGRL